MCLKHPVSSRAGPCKQWRQVCVLSCVPLFGTHGLQPASLLSRWDFPGKNTEAGCHLLLQGIFPAQGSIPSLVSPALAARFFTTGATWEAPCNSGHPVNVDWMNDRSPLSRRWRAGSCRPEMKQTSSLISLGFPRLHLLSCNRQAVLCLSLSGQGEVTQEDRCSLNWTLRWKQDNRR